MELIVSQNTRWQSLLFRVFSFWMNGALQKPAREQERNGQVELFALAYTRRLLHRVYFVIK